MLPISKLANKTILRRNVPKDIEFKLIAWVWDDETTDTCMRSVVLGVDRR
jgi:hypothetical protein